MDHENPHPRVSADPKIMLGKPCITGTRIPVYLILRYLAAGQSEAEIREAFAGVQEGDVAAVLAYASEVMDEPVAAVAE